MESNRAVLDGDAYPEYMVLARALRHDEEEWMSRGNCRKERRPSGSERFWVMKRDDPDFSEDGYRLARQLCEICPVRWECLTFALRERQSFQIWGALDPRQRRDLRKEKDWMDLVEEARIANGPVRELVVEVKRRKAQRKAERQLAYTGGHVSH